MKSTLFLCGAGNAEGVRLALRVNDKSSKWENIIILDDDETKKGKLLLGIEVKGPFSILKYADPTNCEVVNLVARTTEKRLSAFNKIKKYNIPLASLIDPNVDTWGVEYKGDITIYQNVTLSAGAFIDEGSVVFTGAVIGHGCKVGKNCVIAPGAVLNARVELEEGAYVGTNASILPDLKVGSWATIGINSAIVQNIPRGATAMGVPAEIVLMPGDNQLNGLKVKLTVERPNLITKYREPNSDTERILFKIWSQLLKIEKLGADDNFFDLGGHSLLAIQVTSQVKKTLGVNIPLQKFFNFPTISGLSDLIDSEFMKGSRAENL